MNPKSRFFYSPCVIIKKSSNFYAVKYEEKLHDNFKNFQDTVLLVDKGKKHISSTVGHSLMNDHSFSDDRLVQAHKNLTLLTLSKTTNYENLSFLYL